MSAIVAAVKALECSELIHSFVGAAFHGWKLFVYTASIKEASMSEFYPGMSISGWFKTTRPTIQWIWYLLNAQKKVVPCLVC